MLHSCDGLELVPFEIVSQIVNLHGFDRHDWEGSVKPASRKPSTPMGETIETDSDVYSSTSVPEILEERDAEQDCYSSKEEAQTSYSCRKFNCRMPCVP